MSSIIDSSVIETTKNENSALIQKVKTANSSRAEIEKQLEHLNSTYESKSNNLNWWTKAFAGNLGGNKSEVNAINNLVEEIEALEKQLKLGEKAFLQLEGELKQIVTQLIHNNSPIISRKLALNKEFGALNKAASTYNNLLNKVSQGIKDATLFLSWNKLINHPEAAEKIAEFKKSTQIFQDQVSQFGKNGEASIT